MNINGLSVLCRAIIFILYFIYPRTFNICRKYRTRNIIIDFTLSLIIISILDHAKNENELILTFLFFTAVGFITTCKIF